MVDKVLMVFVILACLGACSVGWSAGLGLSWVIGRIWCLIHDWRWVGVSGLGRGQRICRDCGVKLDRRNKLGFCRSCRMKRMNRSQL